MQSNIFNTVGGKAAIVGVLTLLLLIPLLFIQDLVDERQTRYQDAITEVGNKWGSPQEIAGPILVVPYSQYDAQANHTYDKFAYFLPEDVNYKTDVVSQTKKRGIYDVAVYNLKVSVKGKFLKPNFDNLDVPKNNIHLDKAFLVAGLPDTRGITEQVKLNWGSTENIFLPGTNGVLFPEKIVSGIYAPVQVANDSYDFSFDATLLGTNSLNFYPLGKTTTAEVTSSWTSPSFDGNILPTTSDNDNNLKNGFDATWNTSYFSRGVEQNFSGPKDIVAQQLIQIQNKKFGVTFKIAVEFYQKVQRAVKYGVLFVGLTFLVFFCFEVLGERKKRIHTLQYILIGLAMVIFYLLLLSLAEYIGFNFSYLLSTFMTITLVSWYSSFVLANNKSAILVGLMLLIIYLYLFTLLQLEDFALLLGSVATFFVLAVLMYITRKIDWYSIEK